MNVSLVLDAKATLGEGSLWQSDHQKLLWVDIETGVLHELDPLSGVTQQWQLPAKIGTVVPVITGGYLVALQTGIHFFEPGTGTLRLLANPITDPQIRFNDGKCDPAGRFWAGTLHMAGKAGAAALYRLDPDGSLHLMLQNLTNSNGLVWSSDQQTLYFIDTPTQRVRAFDYDLQTGAISRPRTVVQIPDEQGAPDGMTIDAAGNIWVALYGGGAVQGYESGSGKLIGRVEVPAPHTTSCAFGGQDLKTLFITTARQKLSKQQLSQYPHSGGVFAARMPVAGVPASSFRPAPASLCGLSTSS